MDEMATSASTGVLAAQQWLACVAAARGDLTQIPESRRFDVRYEDFVVRPQEYLERIAAFAGRYPEARSIECAVRNVRSDSVGRGLLELDEADRVQVSALLANTRQALGYD